MVTKTELEFNYEPADYFEAPLSLSVKYGRLNIENGKAIYLFTTPLDPVPDTVKAEATRETRTVFDLRTLQANRKYTLLAPSITQYGKDGSVGRSITVSVNEMLTMTGTLDVVAKDTAGNVKHDSREERIKSHKAHIEGVLSKAPNATLTAMLESYRRAMDHPAHELVHLYEVRDAAKEHFGSDDDARKVLRVPEADWKELGRLANSAPIKQGRHSGQHIASLRDAAPEELGQARRIARSIIDAFSNSLP